MSKQFVKRVVDLLQVRGAILDNSDCVGTDLLSGNVSFKAYILLQRAGCVAPFPSHVLSVILQPLGSQLWHCVVHTALVVARRLVSDAISDLTPGMRSPVRLKRSEESRKRRSSKQIFTSFDVTDIYT
ncbi:hypothetical protein J6590_015524 [Homalodisca vitripennis]|nr:hypothetical protein J6590_015524 [Homalodisca vitripennis]